jgi:SAM-dependent methyltransferase
VPGSRVVVVGCGLGDDAEYLASRGAAVTAFDISARAIAWCQERFPNSPVRYVNADLLQLPADLMEAFDLVVECYTVQALPPSLQQAAIAAVATLVAPGGELIIACRGRDATDPPGILPYPLTRRDLDAVPWQQLHWEDFDDPYQPGTRRFRAHWKRV